jgi:hypothetical protein
MSQAVSKSSLVSRLVLVFGVFVLAAMSHLDQTSILKSLFDLLIAGLQEYSRDLSQRLQFRVVDIFTFILGETEKEHRPTGTKTDKQAKAASLALTRPSNALLDNLTSEISVNQTLLLRVQRR